MTNKNIAKAGLEIASQLPIQEIATPANIIYNIANYTGVFDKEGFDKMTDKEIFYDLVFDGRVVDEEKARTSPCKCTIIHPFGWPNKERLECWKPGILGVLSQDQVKKYCPPEKRIMETTTHEARIEKFIEVSDECEFGNEYKSKKIDDLAQRVECVLEGLKKRGLDITEI